MPIAVQQWHAAPLPPPPLELLDQHPQHVAPSRGSLLVLHRPVQCRRGAVAHMRVDAPSMHMCMCMRMPVVMGLLLHHNFSCVLVRILYRRRHRNFGLRTPVVRGRAGMYVAVCVCAWPAVRVCTWPCLYARGCAGMCVTVRVRIWPCSMRMAAWVCTCLRVYVRECTSWHKTASTCHSTAITQNGGTKQHL